ncbi:MAG TPA: 4Fe-4S binding protein [Tissierellia bacterium]|nr:4Fe-4S binding protein [Tissierellia bacterium]
MKRLASVIRLLFFALFVFLVIRGKPMLWLALFGIGLLSTILFGRYYCGYICPMNTIMRPIDRLAKSLGTQTDHTPRWLEGGKLSWIALVVSAALVIAMRRFAGVQFPFLIVWLVLAGLITLRYRPAIFHNLICPFGAPLTLFGRLTRRSKLVDATECIGCSQCIKACPSQAVTMEPTHRLAWIEPAICHQCQDCTAACPVDAISYRSIGS